MFISFDFGPILNFSRNKNEYSSYEGFVIIDEKIFKAMNIFINERPFQIFKYFNNSIYLPNNLFKPFI
jgi:hypothetical protein